LVINIVWFPNLIKKKNLQILIQKVRVLYNNLNNNSLEKVFSLILIISNKTYQIIIKLNIKESFL
jgi:hypothetical protein